MSSTNITAFKKLNGAKVEKRDLDYILNEGKISVSKNEEKNSILHILNSNFYLDKKKRDKIPRLPDRKLNQSKFYRPRDQHHLHGHEHVHASDAVFSFCARGGEEKSTYYWDSR